MTPVQIEAMFRVRIGQEIRTEGGYVNDSNDSGGETCWGITVGRARAAGYTGAMNALTQDRAIEIYRLYYWTQPMFDQLAGVSGEVASLALDFGINMGPSWPGHFLQRALNVLNQGATSYPDITVDGVCGAITRASLYSFLKQRGSDGEMVLCAAVRAQAGVRYIELAEDNVKDESFEYGWLRNRAFSNLFSH